MKSPIMRIALIATLPLALAACGGGGGGGGLDTSYVARDVNTLYALAKESLDRGRYDRAADLFNEVERQHPYSVWARRAMLMGAFSHYQDRSFTDAIAAAQRFLSIHPGNSDAPYAHYLIAMSYYQQIEDISRDQSITASSRDAFAELIRRYPTSRYAADARIKIDLVNDQLAGKEMAVGRFYQTQRKWLAATKRFRSVIDNFETTAHTPEALHRLVESYLALGIPQEAQKAAAVLGHNYPQSEWYERSYELMARHGVQPNS